MSDFDGAGRIVQTAIDAFGTVDIVVNNAGIVRDRTLVKMDEADFDAVIATHLKGTFNVVRHAAPHMKDAGLGAHRQHHVARPGCGATSARPTTARPRPGSWA